MWFYFYIIYSKSIDRFYIGHTNNILDRITKHNTNHDGFTGKTNDWILVYSEKFKSRRLAYERERQVKKWKNRNRIMQLINKASEHLNIKFP